MPVAPPAEVGQAVLVQHEADQGPEHVEEEGEEEREGVEHVNDPCCAATNRDVDDGDKFSEKIVGFYKEYKIYCCLPCKENVHNIPPC